MPLQFDLSDPNKYLADYAQTLRAALGCLDIESVVRAIGNASGRIFVGGNGGSAAISDHLHCDFSKGAGLRVHSLVGGLATFTAIANDIGYDQVFAWQLSRAKLSLGDVVILISSSGNSLNIVNAAKFVKQSNALLIGLTGFDGGVLKRHADLSLHIPVTNYGIVEDAHQAIMHVIAQFIANAPR